VVGNRRLVGGGFGAHHHSCHRGWASRASDFPRGSGAGVLDRHVGIWDGRVDRWLIQFGDRIYATQKLRLEKWGLILDAPVKTKRTQFNLGKFELSHVLNLSIRTTSIAAYQVRTPGTPRKECFGHIKRPCLACYCLQKDNIDEYSRRDLECSLAYCIQKTNHESEEKDERHLGVGPVYAGGWVGRRSSRSDDIKNLSPGSCRVLDSLDCIE
jgi:hypothetical protein